jgi:epoxyqueuosine reductase
MDASRCISYLTIEKRGAIPEDLRAGIGRQVFGCDICQDVCPWNQKQTRNTPPGGDPELAPRAELINPALDWLAAMDQDDFARWFFGSPVKRARFEGLRRNVAIAMGNSGLARYLPQLEEWSTSVDPILRDSASWAMRQIKQKQDP